MKLLSVAIPCYNSEGYMRHCIETLLPGGEDVEIIIVNDGSTKDNTAAIADEYAAKYPTIVKAVHQENGGHGEAVNTGLKNATGLYFKVVDSDDWVDAESYQKVLAKLNELVREGKAVDMMLCNYVYEKQGAKHKRVVHYRSALSRPSFCPYVTYVALPTQQSAQGLYDMLSIFVAEAGLAPALIRGF